MNQPFQHDHSRPLAVNTPDINGDTPDAAVIGRSHLHQATGKTYFVNEAVFVGDSDMWGYRMRGPDGVPIIRTVRDFNATLPDGRARFVPA